MAQRNHILGAALLIVSAIMYLTRHIIATGFYPFIKSWPGQATQNDKYAEALRQIPSMPGILGWSALVLAALVFLLPMRVATEPPPRPPD